jgi:hypothetical protein
MLSFLYQSSNTLLQYSPAIGAVQGLLSIRDKHYAGAALGGAVTVLGVWANRKTEAAEVGGLVGERFAGNFGDRVGSAVGGAVVGPPGGIEGLDSTFRFGAKALALCSTLLLGIRLADLYTPEKFTHAPAVSAAKIGDRSHRAADFAASLPVVYAKIKQWIINEPRIRVHIDSPDYIYFSCASPILGLPEHMGVRLSSQGGRTRVDGRAEIRVFGAIIADDEELLTQFFGFLEDHRYALEGAAAKSA